MKKPILLVVVLLTTLIMARSDSFTTPVFAAEEHCGTISTNETWSNTGNVHVVTCDVTVAPGVTLTITEGTIIKFNRNSLTVDGTLRVLGTASNPVYFTSHRDDTVGGDTNGDGASTAARGDWYSLRFTDNSNDADTLIEHAIIRYAGYTGGSGGGGIKLTGASPTIRNSTITRNLYCALTADLESFPTLSNNTVSENDNNGFCVRGGTISADTTWDITEMTY
jgi:hypothetical protein